MKIACPNPDCKKTLKAKDELAGKKVKCPGCGQIIKLPRLRSDTDTKQSILSAEFVEKIRFNCTCGRSLSVASNLAGKKALCPSCGNIVPVPDRADALTEIEVPPPDEPQSESSILPDEIAPEILTDSDAPAQQQVHKSKPETAQPVPEEKGKEDENDEASTYEISSDEQGTSIPSTDSSENESIGLVDDSVPTSEAEEEIPILSDEVEGDQGEYGIATEQVESAPSVTATCPYCGAAIEEGTVTCTNCGTNILTGEKIKDSGGGSSFRSAPVNTPSLWQSFADSFAYPFKGTGIQMILAFPLINIFMSIAALGMMFLCCAGPILGIIVYGGIYFGFIFHLMKCAATGPGVEPEWPNFSEFWEEMALPFMKLLLATIIFAGAPIAASYLGFKVPIPLNCLVSSTNTITGEIPEANAQEEAAPIEQTTNNENLALNEITKKQNLGAKESSTTSVVDMVKLISASIPFLIVLLIVWFCYPMTFTIVGIYDSFVGGINPVVIFRSIFSIPLDYVLVWIFLNILIVANISARVIISLALGLIPYGHYAGYVIYPMLSIYLWFVAASCLGFMAYRNRAKLGW